MKADRPRQVVADTGPLITLEKVSGGHEFIKLLYDEILIPSSVAQEVIAGQFESIEDYTRHFGIGDLLVTKDPSRLPGVESAHLDDGERQAIALASEKGLSILIEEEAGRLYASFQGIPVSGIAGLILRAAREELIPTGDAVTRLSELRAAGRIGQQLLEALLGEIGRLPKHG